MVEQQQSKIQQQEIIISKLYNITILDRSKMSKIQNTREYQSCSGYGLQIVKYREYIEEGNQSYLRNYKVGRDLK